jgi:hypothetical protein
MKKRSWKEDNRWVKRRWNNGRNSKDQWVEEYEEKIMERRWKMSKRKIQNGRKSNDHWSVHGRVWSKDHGKKMTDEKGNGRDGESYKVKGAREKIKRIEKMRQNRT